MTRRTLVASMMAVGMVLGGTTLAEGTGTIKGTVTFKGGKEALSKQDKRKSIKTQAADPNCTKKIGTNRAHVRKLADGAGLRYVMVSIESDFGGKKFETPSAPVVLDQIGCEYKPHVLGIMKGQDLLVKNSDNTSHNIHGLAKKNDEFNKSQPAIGMKFTLNFDEIELFKTKCDIHNWMSCYIAIFDHPFFNVSQKDGTYEIKNVPPGKYTLKFWHETFGEKTIDIEVSGPGSTAEANMEFDAK